MKTVGFSQIVARCGTPSVHLSWVPPERDRALKSALKQNRVMTVHQNLRGNAKDYGTVGLLQTPHAQILVFPRSLKRFEERRVVGIDYSLLSSTSEKKGGAAAAAKRPTRPPRRGDETTPKSKPDRSRAEFISFKTQDVAEPDDVAIPFDADGATRGRDEESTIAKNPPTWSAVAERIAQARKALEKRRVAVARAQLEQLEKWIRETGKLSEEV